MTERVDTRGLNICLTEYNTLSKKPKHTPHENKRMAYLQTAISAIKAGATLAELEQGRLEEKWGAAGKLREAQVRLEEAKWWAAHLPGKHGTKLASECKYCKRILELERTVWLFESTPGAAAPASTPDTDSESAQNRLFHVILGVHPEARMSWNDFQKKIMPLARAAAPRPLCPHCLQKKSVCERTGGVYGKPCGRL